MKKKKIMILLCSTVVLLNLAACSVSFCNQYTLSFYGALADFYGKITNPIPFPIGELIMYLGCTALFLAAALLILYPLLKKSRQFAQFAKEYLKNIVFVILLFLFLYTTLWLIPFRSSLLGKQETPKKEYTTKELRLLWLYVIENLNDACTQVERDEHGLIIYSDKEDTEKKVAEAMKNLSDTYQRLQGFYPTMKPALCSDVLKWMRIGGYTYPYTMEVTYNKYTTDLYYPALYAHESAHHKGYYQENEANFLSYLSLVNSNDPVLRYSALHEIYYYVDEAYASTLSDAADTLVNEYKNTAVSNQVWLDEKEETKKVNSIYEKESHPLETYSEAAKEVSDIGWETQGEILAENSYNGVVKLLLEYYDGKLW